MFLAKFQFQEQEMEFFLIAQKWLCRVVTKNALFNVLNQLLQHGGVSVQD